MPAKSRKQQQAAGADLRRIREGKQPRTFKGASVAELRRVASTKHKGLPKRKKGRK